MKFGDDVEAWFWREALLRVAEGAPRRAWRDCVDFADYALQSYRDRVGAWNPDGSPDSDK